jgi:hypothetical protein
VCELALSIERLYHVNYKMVGKPFKIIIQEVTIDAMVYDAHKKCGGGLGKSIYLVVEHSTPR